MTDNCILKKIRYETSGGSMNFHSEFELEASPDEVIKAGYWKDFFFGRAEEEASQETLRRIDDSYRTNNGGDGMIVREHVPMDQELWGALSEEMGYLKEQLVPVNDKPTFSLPEDVFVLDGGDYTRLYLTWDDTCAEKNVQYYAPSGNRWASVIDILHEMVRPLGRDLRRIGKTQLTEMFLKTSEYSYQITPIKGENHYYFFVHGDKSNADRMSQEQWVSVCDYLNGIDFSGFGTGKYECRYYLRLSYNDGINKHLEINHETAEMIRSFLQLRRYSGK